MEEVILCISCQRERRETEQIHKQFENNLLEKLKKLLTNTWTHDIINELTQTAVNKKWQQNAARTLITEQWNNLERFKEKNSKNSIERCT